MEDGSNYIGTLNTVTKLQHGHGTQHFIDKSQYVGEYKDGMFDGNGKYMYSNGNVYEGEFKNYK